MKEAIQKIKVRLEELTEGMYYSYVADEPYLVEVWDKTEKGDFSLEHFLIEKKGLVSYTAPVFLSWIKKHQPEPVHIAYKELFDTFKEHLSDFAIYGYQFPQLGKYLFDTKTLLKGKAKPLMGSPVFIGQTEDGTWLGMTLRQNNKSKVAFPVEGVKEVGVETENLLEQLEELKGDLAHTIKIKNWEITQDWVFALTTDRASCIEKLFADAKLLTTATLDKFLGIEDVMESWKEGNPLPKEKKLQNYLTENTNEPKVYTFDFVIDGEWLGVHLVVGKLEDGSSVGVLTDSFTF